MKQIFATLAIVLITGCIQHTENQIPVIEGSVTNYDSSGLLFCTNNITESIIDTVYINEEGKFYIYQNSVDTTAFYCIKTNKYKINLFLKPNDFVQLSFDANNPDKTLHSTNSKFHTFLWKMEQNQNKFSQEIKNIDHQFQNYIDKEDADSAVSRLKEQKDSIIQSYRNYSLDLMQKTNSPVLDYIILNQKYKNTSLFSLQDDLSLFLKNSEQLINDKDLKPLFEEYDKHLLLSYGTIRNIQRHDAGEKFPALTARTKWGGKIELSQLNGKLILVIFWDGKDDNIYGRLKEIKKTYSKFSRNGLKLLFVAFQKDKDLWDKTLSDNKLPYWHLIDTLDIQSPDIKNLGIRSLPYNFLITPDSTIIKRGEWGDELDNTILSFIKKY